MAEETNESVDETELETEEPKGESEIEHQDKDSIDAKLARLERENRRLHKKVGDLESHTKEPKKDTKSDDAVMNRLDNMARKIAGIQPGEEEELFNKWKVETGREADSIIESKIFQTELADLRTAKANAAATTNIKGEGSASGTKDDPDYWIAKSTKDSEGNPVFPDDLPNDFRLRAAIVEKMVASTKSNKQFYNQ